MNNNTLKIFLVSGLCVLFILISGKSIFDSSSSSVDNKNKTLVDNQVKDTNAGTTTKSSIQDKVDTQNQLNEKAKKESEREIEIGQMNTKLAQKDSKINDLEKINDDLKEQVAKNLGIENERNQLKNLLEQTNQKLNLKQDKLTKAEGGSLVSNQYFWLLILLIILLLIISTITGLSALYLYRWRISFSDKENLEVLLPEHFHELMTSFQDSIKNLDSSMSNNTVKFRELERMSLDKMEDISNTVIQFKNSINIKDKEIERFKEGYDLKIYKNFIKKFIAIKESFDNVKKGDYSDDVLKIFTNLENRFLDAFDDCEVEEFKAEIGKSVKDYLADDLSIEFVKPLNATSGGTIKEVISVGYRSKKPDGSYLIIKPTKVIAYKIKAEENPSQVKDEDNKKIEGEDDNG
tara:strand:- start:315 stop:1532 length:1218 start_codon:yes stop_codon:yes gene_type:complete